MPEAYLWLVGWYIISGTITYGSLKRNDILPHELAAYCILWPILIATCFVMLFATWLRQ